MKSPASNCLKGKKEPLDSKLDAEGRGVTVRALAGDLFPWPTQQNRNWLYISLQELN